MKRVMYSGFGLLLIALLFLAFNLGSSLLFSGVRLDLTQQKLYTISAGTRQILAEIDKPVDLYLFYSDSGSKDLVPLRNYAMRVKELLKAYERDADGKIKLHIIDPLPFSEDEDKAASFGLQAVPLGQGAAPVYFGLAGTDTQNNVRAIPFFSPEQEELLEYDISRLLQTLSSPKRPVVGLLSTLPVNGGFDARTQRKTEPWMLMKEIHREFDLKELRDDVKEIPQDVSVLMLVHPQLSQATLYAVDQFVLRGGKLLAFVDPYSEQDPGTEVFGVRSNKKSSDLAPLFKAWGMQMLPGKVLGDGAYGLPISVEPGQRPIRQPSAIELPNAALNQGDISTAGLESINLATAGIFEPLEGATTVFTPLMQSSEYAMPFEASRFGKLTDLGELMRDLVPTGQRYVLAARIQGAAKSAFPDGIDGKKNGLKEAQQINVLAVADTDLLSDRLWVTVQDFYGQRVPQPWADNGSFVINALDNLAGSDALNSVRSRGRFSRPFVLVEQLQREAEDSYREKESSLQQSLRDTEQKLAELQGQGEGRTPELTAEQQATMRQFMQEKMRIRKELREVEYQLNLNIDALGRMLKIINIAFVPLLLTLCVLLAWGFKYVRRVLGARRKVSADGTIQGI